jgi:hypothetical protein
MGYNSDAAYRINYCHTPCKIDSSDKDTDFYLEDSARSSKKYKKSKAIPVTGSGGLTGCEMLRIPPCLDDRLTDGGKVVSPMH